MENNGQVDNQQQQQSEGNEEFTDLATAIQQIKAAEQGQSTDDNESDGGEQDSQVEAPKEESQKQPEKPNEDQTSDKKTQSAEDNAKFAEQRRQKQIEDRVNEELQKRLDSLPEVKAAKLLSEIYNIPQDQVYDRLNEARLQQEAQRTGKTVDALKKEQEIVQTTQEVADENVQLKFQMWQQRVNQESISLKEQYPGLSDDDIQEATNFMLKEAKNPEMPLKRAILAVAGDKLFDTVKEATKNEVLAEQAGRKSSPLAPQGGKSNTQTPTLSEDERYVMKLMGIGEKDWLKYK